MMVMQGPLIIVHVADTRTHRSICYVPGSGRVTDMYMVPVQSSAELPVVIKLPLPVIVGIAASISIDTIRDLGASLVSPLIPGLDAVARLLPDALSPHRVLALDTSTIVHDPLGDGLPSICLGL